MKEERSDLRSTESSAIPPLGSGPSAPGRSSRGRIGWTCLVLAIAALIIIRDLAAAILLASWSTVVLWPLRNRLVIRFGHPALISYLMTTALVVAFLAPLALLGTSIGFTIAGWVQVVVESVRSGNFDAIINSILGRGPGASAASAAAQRGLSDLIREAARTIPTVLAGVGAVVSVLANAAIKIVVFVVGVYSFLLHGSAIGAFVERVSPFPKAPTQRLMRVYVETGRGLLIGVFLVMLVHGIVAGVGYLIIGIPRAIELGSLTAVASLVPGIGTGLVWIPICLVMLVTKQIGRAIAMLGLGIAIGLVDNVARPWLSRLGQVPLSIFPLFIAIFGGVATFGPSGLLTGPLVLTLAKTAAELYMEEKHAALAPAPELESPQG